MERPRKRLKEWSFLHSAPSKIKRCRTVGPNKSLSHSGRSVESSSGLLAQAEKKHKGKYDLNSTTLMKKREEVRELHSQLVKEKAPKHMIEEELNKFFILDEALDFE